MQHLEWRGYKGPLLIKACMQSGSPNLQNLKLHPVTLKLPAFAQQIVCLRCLIRAGREGTACDGGGRLLSRAGTSSFSATKAFTLAVGTERLSFGSRANIITQAGRWVFPSCLRWG